jgi:cob(I)alamin adenosyltransferase
MRADTIHPAIPSYIHRLSDLFFTLSRAEMDKAGVAEEKWKLFLYKRFKTGTSGEKGKAIS